MLAFHMDDSADAQRKKVFVVAGLLGHSDEWFEAERHWEKVLERHRIDYFRASNLARLEGGGFERLVQRHGHAEARAVANQLWDDLKLILKSSNLVVGALGVLMKDYRKVLAERSGARVLQSDPYIHAHQQLICKIASFSCETVDKPYVAFLYDQHNKAKKLQSSWETFKERNPICAECMGTLAPLDDEEFPCIQMADLIANATKRMFERKIDAGQPIRRSGDAVELEEMAEWARRIGWIGYWEENYLRLMVRHNLKYAPAPVKRWPKKKCREAPSRLLKNPFRPS